MSPNNSYQPLITGPVGANVLEDVQDTCYTRNMDPLPRWTSFTPIKPSDVVYMNIDYNEFSDLDQNSPSSDSGIHSYDEHWAVLSTESPNSDSIQISESTRSIDISPVQERIVPVRQCDSQFHRGVVNTLHATLIKHGSVSDLNTDGYNSDVAAMADFSDEDIEQWEDEETHVEEQPSNQAFLVRHESVSDLSTDDYNSDVAALEDFSDEDIEPWEDEETCVTKQLSLRTDLVADDTSNIIMGSYDYAILHKIPPKAVPHDPDDEFRMDYWRNFRVLMNKALLLDDMQLIESDYPEIVKACIFRNRWILLVKKEREDLCVTALYDSDEEEVVALSEDYFRFKLEEYWTYHDERSNMGNKMDDESEPDARAKVDVSPTAAVPNCMTGSMLFTSWDFDVCRQDIGRFIGTYCLGLCGSSDDIYCLKCARCVDILIWGFRVSCVISFVITWTLISIDEFYKGFNVFDGVWGLTDGLITPGDDILRCLRRTKAYKEISPYVMIGSRAMITCCGFPWRLDNGLIRACCASLDLGPIRISGRFGCWCYTVLSADWMDVQPVDGGPVRMVIWIEYIGDGHSRYGSSDAAPITEVHDISRVLHFPTDCLTGLSKNPLVSISPRIVQWVEYDFCYSGAWFLCAMMEGAASAEDRSGVIFTAELCVPWDAPEAVVAWDSVDLVSLGPFPDKVGLFGRRKDAAMSHIMRGRDSRSVRFVVPDGRLVDRGFHDVTVVDMEEEREPTIVRQDMTRLREIWPAEVFDYMKWRQQDLELMRKSAKKDYQQNRPMPCRFCGKVIRVDMYRHVARLHLDLVQLWRCPIAWCTTWKGSPQDCLEHVRSGHDAPWIEKTASVEQYAPPWTVRR